MQVERHMWLACLLLLVVAPNCLAQTLDAQQIKLIQQTAANICDTVKEAKGSKTNVEIKGEIEAKLKGLAAKFASVGGSGQGAFKDESFVGLSQDATAAALEGDRGCRERVFNKMFDRIESPKDRKAALEATSKPAVKQFAWSGPLAGTMLGNGQSQSEACSRAKSSTQIQGNANLQIIAQVNPTADLRLDVSACECSQDKILDGTAFAWTCNATWSVHPKGG